VKETQGKARQVMGWQCNAGQVKGWKGKERKGKERKVKERQGRESKVKVRHCKARHGMGIFQDRVYFNITNILAVVKMNPKLFILHT